MNRVSIQRLARIKYPSTAYHLIYVRFEMLNNRVLTYREAFSIVTAKWRNLSDAEREEFCDLFSIEKSNLNIESTMSEQ